MQCGPTDTLRPQRGLTILNDTREAQPSQPTTTVITHIIAGQRAPLPPSRTAPQRHEQRIRSVEPKLTLQHLTRNVFAGQGSTEVGRVGLEPTADGL